MTFSSHRIPSTTSISMKITSVFLLNFWSFSLTHIDRSLIYFACLIIYYVRWKLITLRIQNMIKRINSYQLIEYRNWIDKIDSKHLEHFLQDDKNSQKSEDIIKSFTTSNSFSIKLHFLNFYNSVKDKMCRIINSNPYICVCS